MIIGLLLLQLLLCSALLYLEIVRNHFRNYATAIFFATYEIVYIIEPLFIHLVFKEARTITRGAAYGFSDDNVYYVFNLYGLTLIGVALVLSLRDWTVSGRREIPQNRECTRTAEMHYAAYLAIIIVVGVFVFIHSTGMSVSGLLQSSRFEWFGEDSFSLIGVNVSFYLLGVIPLYAYYVWRGGNRGKVLAVPVLALVVMCGMMTKDRKWVLYLISGWVAANYDMSGRRLKASVRAIAIGSVVFILLVFSQFIRDVFARYAGGENVDIREQFDLWLTQSFELGDISYFYRATLEAIDQNMNNGFLIPFAVVRRIVFFAVPYGYSGGLKVEDIAATFSDVVDGGSVNRRGNMPPGLFGLFAISFGWWMSFLFIPFLALLLKWLDWFFRFRWGVFRAVVLSFFLSSAILLFRGDESSSVYFVISTMLMIGVAWLLREFLTRSLRGRGECVTRQ